LEQPHLFKAGNLHFHTSQSQIKNDLIKQNN